MILRFAQVLEVTTDELLQPQTGKQKPGRKPSRKVMRRLEQIESLPRRKQEAPQQRRYQLTPVLRFCSRTEEQTCSS